MAPNQHHTEYAPPVMRAPSPASSIGTHYEIDQTSLSDKESIIGQEDFENKWEDRLQLRNPRKEEEEAENSPLIPRSNNPTEMRAMHEQIMRSLRWEVQQLEENELFEQTLLRGSQVGMESLPSTSDIDTILQSMMTTDSNTSINTIKDPDEDVAMRVNGTSPPAVTDGPWNRTTPPSIFTTGKRNNRLGK
ncbi:hypothetical protein BDN72DRAFT_794669 [Pluteus cervinus]|uniref:Uncharacterized protein n=1 Tax=Pluteus cervinus TaxID=181527 RepID=A0ACD3B007_9AGAR|nr:hypothetical protein BDN72DRAFT_794669 [Pluteus cervinus]